MAPESTVRGRENDFLVRSGYIHPQIPGFSGGYGIFRRFTLWIKDRVTQGRIELTSFRLLILSYTLDHSNLVHRNTKYKILSPSLTFPARRHVKYQRGRGTCFPSPMLLFYIPPCWKTFPAWRNEKYQHGRGTKCSGTHRVFSHSQNCNFPEESFILSTFRNSVDGKIMNIVSSGSLDWDPYRSYGYLHDL